MFQIYYSQNSLLGVEHLLGYTAVIQFMKRGTKGES